MQQQPQSTEELEDKTRIESEITRIKLALRPSTLLVMEPTHDYSKNPEILEFMGSSAGAPFLVRCIYLVTKLLWLYIKRVFLKMTNRTGRS